MIKNHKNILFTIIFIILAFFGYWYFVLSKKDASTSNSLTAKAVGVGATQQPGQKAYDKEFVSNLQTIQYINLDTSILGSVAYNALDFPRVPFQINYAFPIGRNNPFLPIGVGQNNTVSPNSQDQNNTDVVPVSSDVQAPVSVSTTTVKVLPKPKKR